jgi:hypothetical protein
MPYRGTPKTTRSATASHALSRSAPSSGDRDRDRVEQRVVDQIRHPIPVVPTPGDAAPHRHYVRFVTVTLDLSH